ncbi:hypothetical protein PQQ65_18000 [Paraburkholderia strydomiana]|jgi:hypothetical protein|uniref:DUF2783 domain-containing protein n=1 Tax=Paraburkholderia caledonica TaxID=134536 RepID=A0AB73IAP4_9BURK|nr:hypothetical protein [Paraburkholderia strydomiana]MDP9647068.1 hypothetical protein [Paraburkholderia caledonica]MDR7003363.1 hypothetical protein [Paraburkholderia strydomiana]
MTDSDLERIYTTLCQNITAEGEAQAPLYLARLALLCMTELDDTQRALSLIEAARLPSPGAVTAAT